MQFIQEYIIIYLIESFAEIKDTPNTIYPSVDVIFADKFMVCGMIILSVWCKS